MNIKFEYFKLTGLIKFFSILSFKEKKNIIFLFFFMFIASLLETLSIGILIPLINFILDPNLDFGFIHVGFFNRFSDYDFFSLMIIAIFLIYLIKYLFLIFYAYFNASVLLNVSAS